MIYTRQVKRFVMASLVNEKIEANPLMEELDPTWGEEGGSLSGC